MPRTKRILIVAPSSNLRNQDAELRGVASGHYVRILDGQVTAREFETTVRSEPFDVVHFIIHGTFGVIQFTDGPYGQERLAHALRNQEQLELVFINACNSAGTGAKIHRELPVTVIAHECDANDEGAMFFAKEFYTLYGEDTGLHRAFDDAENSTQRRYPALPSPILINGRQTQINALTTKVDNLATVVEMMAVKVDGLVPSLKRWFVIMMAVALALFAALHLSLGL